MAKHRIKLYLDSECKKPVKKLPTIQNAENHYKTVYVRNESENPLFLNFKSKNGTLKIAPKNVVLKPNENVKVDYWFDIDKVDWNKQEWEDQLQIYGYEVPIVKPKYAKLKRIERLIQSGKLEDLKTAQKLTEEL